MPTTIALTGGAGFIGVHLTARLLAQGFRVVVLDDLSAPSALGLPAGAELTVADVRDAEAVLRLCDDAAQLIHLASVVGVDAVTASPERTGAVIRKGTANALEACARSGARLMSFSSSEVTDPPRSGPRAEYAQAKRDAEQLLLAHAGQVDVTIVRPFNIVGPGQSAPGMVLPAFAAAARSGSLLGVHGSGQQERSFLHVSDLVTTVLALMDQPAGPRGLVVEIGSEERLTILGLAERLSEMAGSGARPTRRAPHAGREDRPRRGPDLSTLRARVPFSPARDLDDILREALVHA